MICYLKHMLIKYFEFYLASVRPLIYSTTYWVPLNYSSGCEHIYAYIAPLMAPYIPFHPGSMLDLCDLYRINTQRYKHIKTYMRRYSALYCIQSDSDDTHTGTLKSAVECRRQTGQLHNADNTATNPMMAHIKHTHTHIHTQQTH